MMASLWNFLYLLTFMVQIGISPILAQTRGVDPCNPSMCGPNTYCSVRSTGAAVCQCLPGYFPKHDTITGCGHQCDFDTQCRLHERCFGNKCQAACQAGICGVNAECEPQNHRAVCKCPRGYLGDALNQCTQQTSVARRIISHPTTLIIRESDPCSGNPCGPNTECRNSAHRPVCTCLPNHRGDPYRGCRRGECESNSECPSHNVCQNYHCMNPCTSACGINVNCDVRGHVAHCSCPPGYTGDASRSCRIYDENELCNPTPCGTNTKCRVDSGRAVCSCLPTYKGNPLSGCRRECESDSQCRFNQACMDYKCRDPCSGGCGQYATCDVRNHVAICSCPSEFLGDPYTRCFPECTSHAECPANRACNGLKCGDPCAGACGINAECRVDKSSHNAICSCPKGYTGHPFKSCRPQTPGNRGECLSDAECGVYRVCRNNVCENPCLTTCGVNADCDVRNGVAICSCPRNFRGDPYRQCTAEPYRGRRQAKGKVISTSENKKVEK